MAKPTEDKYGDYYKSAKERERLLQLLDNISNMKGLGLSPEQQQQLQKRKKTINNFDVPEKNKVATNTTLMEDIRNSYGQFKNLVNPEDNNMFRDMQMQFDPKTGKPLPISPEAMEAMMGFAGVGSIKNFGVNAGKAGKALLQQYLARAGGKSKQAIARGKQGVKNTKGNINNTVKQVKGAKLRSELGLPTKMRSSQGTWLPNATKEMQKAVKESDRFKALIHNAGGLAGLGAIGGIVNYGQDWYEPLTMVPQDTPLGAGDAPHTVPYLGSNDDGLPTNTPIVPQHGGAPEGGTYGPFDDPTIQRVAPMSPQQRAQVIASIQPVAAPPRAPNAYDDRLNPFGIGSGYEELQRPRAVR